MEQIKVGGTYDINNHKVFITEKRTGRMMGSEGQFSSVLPLKDPFGYASGSADNTIVSVNFWPDEIELSIGEELEHHEIQLQ